MSLDPRLVALLVCPLCKGPLELLRDTEQHATELACPADRLAFPIRDGVPVMLEAQARSLSDNGAPPAASSAGAGTPA